VSGDQSENLQWAPDAEQAVLFAMKSLPSKYMNARGVVPSSIEILLKTAGDALDRARARTEIEAAVVRLVHKGDIEAPIHGSWRLLRE
jgi:hypothetical protein